MAFKPPKEQKIEHPPKSGIFYRFGVISHAVIEEFYEWMREQEGDPYADFARWKDDLPEAERVKLFRECRDRAQALLSLDFNGPIAERYKKTPRGAVFVIRAMLATNHPEITDETAFAVWQTIVESDPDGYAKLLQNAQGTPPAKNVETRPQPTQAERIAEKLAVETASAETPIGGTYSASSGMGPQILVPVKPAS
jgi:hypothetical protein